MLRALTRLSAACALGLLSLLAVAQGNGQQTLAEQAQYWEQKGRFDLARENWLKLLRTSPDNADALAGLGLAEARSGRAAAAQVYLDRLRETHPQDPRIAQVEDAIRSGAFDPSQLDRPRQLARAGQYDEAVAAYREVFGGSIPDGRLGLEYYQTLAGAKDGWAPARDGIQRLQERDPSDPIYRLALAQHLTYREETRREGITQLTALADNASVAAPVQQAWRQALIWLGGGRSGDEPLFKRYLTRYGQDREIAGRLEALEQSGRRSAPSALAAAPRAPTAEELRGQEVKRAYDLLNDGRLDEAGSMFERLQQQTPSDADVLGGLGIVRLREQRFAEARRYLEDASKRAPKSASRWKEALSTARFWEQVRAAEAARQAGNRAEAERLFRAAIASDSTLANKELSVKSSLAALLAEQGRYEEAERVYRELLAREPENGDSLRGLIGVLVQTKRIEEALQLADRLPPAQQAELGNLGALRGQFLREQAQVAIDNRDDARAEELLRQALLLDPESPWTRLDLARIYQRQKRIREANTLIDGLLPQSGGSGGPTLSEAYFVKAMLLAENQRWLEGLEILERIDPAQRTQPMADLQRRLWVRYQAERAGVFARAGRADQAAGILQQIEPYSVVSPELLGAIAFAWADVGDDGRAMAYMRQALSRTPNPDLGLRLAYAGLLFKLRQDAEFEVVMEDLVRQPGFDERQALELANLRVGYRLRQADLVREEGDLARAYEYLEPLLRVNPDDPRLLMALARLYNDAKEFDRAYQLYQRVLGVDGDNLDAHKGAVGALLAMNRPEEAEALLENAFRLAPNNPRLYALAGRAARARGEDGRALQLYQQALRLDQSSGGESEFGGGSTPQLYLLDPRISGGEVPYYGHRAPQRPVVLASLAPPAPTVGAKKKSTPPRVARAGFAEVGGRWVRAGRDPDRSQPPRPADRRGGLIRTSTPARGSTAPAPAPAPSASGGYWVQDSPTTYRYIQGQPGMAPAPAPAYSTYQVPPRPIAQASETRPASRYPSLREEVLRDIGEITGTPASGSPAAPAAPVTVPRPVLQPSYRTAPSYAPSSQPGYLPPAVRQSVPVPATLPPPQVAPVYGERPVELGAPVQAYEAQGLRVLEGSPQPYGSVPAPVYSSPAPVYLAPAPAPVYVPAPQLRADPLLKPSFTQPVQDRPNEVMREIADIQARRSAYAGFGLGLRSRDGVAGLDRLTDLETPIELSLSAMNAGRFKLRVVPVVLDAGTVAGAQLPLFGALALVDPDVLAGRRFDQNESGLAPGLVYEVADFRLDVGASPLGFPVETLVGGINWRPKSERTSFKIDLSRRSVTDSLLSYAGTRDPATGETWGGVTKTGGRLDVSYDLGDYGVYANAGYAVLDGENVARNSVVELGGGLYVRALKRRDMQVTWGVNVTTFAYDKNLRRFSLGHGGYFSPQSYFSLALPVEWEGGRNRFSYRVAGALGIQSFREDGQALFPNNSDLQLAIEELVADNPDLNLVAGYPGQTSTGLGFNLEGEFEYLIGPHLAAGARLSLDNARDYDEASAYGYLRYLFNGQPRANNPPSLLQPYFDFGDPTQ